MELASLHKQKIISKPVLNNLYWEKNLTQKEIGTLFDIPVGSMPWVFKKYGIKARDTFKAKNISKALLKRLYVGKGLDCNKIAKIVGVSGHTIGKYLKIYGFKVKSGSSYKKLRLPKNEIIKLYIKDGFSATEIASRYNTSTPTILSRFKRWGITVSHGDPIVKMCGQCNSPVKIWLKDIRNSKTGKYFCNLDCKGKYFSGPKAPAWKGGIAAEPYCPVWLDKEYKESIKVRDNHKCQNPDCWCKVNKLSLHHIDYDKKNCHPDNLITLCVSCNSRANTDREWHTAYYNAFMQRSGKTINDLTT